MAKLTFTDPTLYWFNRNKKRIGGTVIYNKNNVALMQSLPQYKPRKKFFLRKSNISFIRSAIAYFDVVTEAYLRWQEYIRYADKSRSGYNAVIKNNVQLLHHDLPGITAVFDITSPAQNPDLPACMAAWFDADNNIVIFEWKDIYPKETYLAFGVYNTVRRYIPPDNRYKIRGAEVAGAESYVMPSSFFAYGRLAIVAFRACNDRGEVSPWSDPIEIEVPDRPETNFRATPRSGPVPLEVVFTDLTKEKVFSWLWNFGDGQFSTDQHPIHTYEIDQDYFNVKLIAYGVANSKKSLIKYKYIKITDQPEDYGSFFVSDNGNYRICVRFTDDLSYFTSFGSQGVGDGQFESSIGICVDNLFIYVCDMFSDKISKFSKIDYSFIGKYYYPPASDHRIYMAQGVVVDDVYGYIGDRGKDRVVRFLKSDMTYVDEVKSWSGGTDQLHGPHGVAVDDENIYVCDEFNHRIVKFQKSDFLFLGKIGSLGSGEDEFHYPSGIACDRTYIYIADLNNHRIVKRRKSNLAFVASVGSLGSGDTQFNYPVDVSVGAVHLYVADRNNHRVVKLLKDDLSFVAKIGSEGSGDDQFSHPWGIAIMSPYSF